MRSLAIILAIVILILLMRSDDSPQCFAGAESVPASQLQSYPYNLPLALALERLSSSSRWRRVRSSWSISLAVMSIHSVAEHA